MEREIVCISCPIGCRLTATWTNEEDIHIEGNLCPRGEVYGREEILAPKRVVTATCAAVGDKHVRIPVKTDGPLPKELMDELLNALYRLEVPLPVTTGDVIMTDIGGTGVDLVASGSVS